MQKTDGAAAIDKVFDVAELIAASPDGLTAGDVAEETGLPRPTVYRLLAVLTRRGYLVSGPDRRFRIGFAFLRIGSRVQAVGWVRSVSRPLLWELTKASGCSSAQIATLDQSVAVFVERTSLPGPSFRLDRQPGDTVPLNSTAVGKALLAQLSEADARALLAIINLTPVTPATPTDPEAILAELAEIRSVGFATSVAEYADDVWSVAAPVPIHLGGARYAVGISEHMWRYSHQRLLEVGQLVKRAAGKVAEALLASPEGATAGASAQSAVDAGRLRPS